MEASSADAVLCQHSLGFGHVTAAKLDQTLLLMIAEMCDTPTKAQLCRLNRQVRNSLQLLLFRCVEIRGTSQLAAFARCVSEVDNQDGMGDKSASESAPSALLLLA